MKRTTKEKKQLLSRLFEKKVQDGISIFYLVGKPLSFFDYDKIQKELH